MGGERTTTRVESNTTTQGTQSSQTQYTPTPEETRLNQLEIQRQEATQQGLIGAQTAGLDLVQSLLRGSEPLPGFFQQLSQGISPEVTSSIVQNSLADITPSFVQSGLLDSGVRASVSGRIAGDIRRGAEEFNIGNRLNLLNLALSGQAQVQQPILAANAQLSGSLAGLRSVSQTGTSSGSSTGYSNSTVMGMNPFMKSFQTSLGSSLGSGIGKGVSGAAGGFFGF